MKQVSEQYEAFPYPARDPADEAKRLITGSPSHPLEIDHFVFGGVRDWSKPFRALVAGGGTGDALIQLAQLLSTAGRSYDITYVDLSRASRKQAEARAQARGLTGIRFITGSLLDAPDLGRFDYIDCCGVLHHLPEPQVGFNALAQALAPGGGLGVMVYAPYGRSGVYALQEAFGSLLSGPAPERLAIAKAIYARLPDGHPVKRNPHLVDHHANDAGFYDLLLHAQDRPFDIASLLQALAEAGLEMTGSPQAHLYDPTPLVGAEGAQALSALGPVERMVLAEKLRGTIKTHILYATRPGEGREAKPVPQAVPHLKSPQQRRALAASLAKGGVMKAVLNGEDIRIPVPQIAARAIAGMNGTRSLEEIAAKLAVPWLAFAPAWAPVSRAMTAAGLLYYSGLTRH